MQGMNTANLQIEGLLLATAALVRLLREKGLVTVGELDAALENAQRAATFDARRPEQMSPANVEAVLFPLRFLREVNARPDAVDYPPFSEITTAVGLGRRKPPAVG